MNARHITGMTAALVATGLCFGASVLAADELPVVTIEADALPTKIPIGHSSLGVPLEQITLLRRVSYADLDLSTRAGEAELRKRVKSNARAACRQLDQLYPMEIKNAPQCIKKAIAEASRQVDAAVAAAEKQAKAG